MYTFAAANSSHYNFIFIKLFVRDGLMFGSFIFHPVEEKKMLISLRTELIGSL